RRALQVIVERGAHGGAVDRVDAEQGAILLAASGENLEALGAEDFVLLSSEDAAGGHKIAGLELTVGVLDVLRGRFAQGAEDPRGVVTLGGEGPLLLDGEEAGDVRGVVEAVVPL